MTDQIYYDYRLVLPTGLTVEKKLPFIAMSGDIISLHKGDYKVIGTDPTLIHSNVCTLYLEKF